MAQYFQAGIILITVPNLIVILLMVIVFAIGIAVQLPHPPANVPDDPHSLAADAPPNTQPSSDPIRLSTQPKSPQS